MPGTADRSASVVLGFDWGTQKIGVAVGQEITGTATSLPALRAVQGVPDWHEVERLVAAWQPGLFIVGIPLNMDGSESESSHRASRFARSLSGRFAIPWVGVDERLSSVAARSELAEAPDGGAALDSVAARMIVESWLDERRQARR